MIVIGTLYRGRRRKPILLKGDYIIFPCEESSFVKGRYFVFGIKVPKEATNVKDLEDDLILIEYREQKVMIFKDYSFKTLFSVNRMESVVDRSYIHAFEDLKNLAERRGVIDLRSYKAELGDIIKDKISSFHCVRMLVVVVEGKRVRVKTFHEKIRPLITDYLDRYFNFEYGNPSVVTHKIGWNYRFRSNMALIYRLPENMVIRASGEIIKDEYKERLNEFLEDEDVQETVNELMKEEVIRMGFDRFDAKTVLGILMLMGAVYGKRALVKASEAIPIFESALEIHDYNTKSLLISFIVNFLITLSMWRVLPYEIERGKLRKIVLVNKPLNLSMILGENGFEGYEVGETPLKEMFIKRIFVNEKNFIENLGEEMSKDLVKVSDSYFKNFLFYNLIDELKEVEIRQGMVVNAKVKYGFMKLEEVWKKRRSVRDKILNNIIGKKRYLTRIIEEAKRAEERRFEEFKGSILERLKSSELIINDVDVSPGLVAHLY